MDVSLLLKTIISLLASLITLIGSISVPSPSPDVDNNESVDTGIYHNSTIIQTPFNEGEFKMGKYDLVVAPDGNDLNKGTLENPLKTVNGAKEKLELLKDVTNETVTVWFRSGTYLFTEELTFDSSDFSNVIYRSYPNEDVVFSGSVDFTEWSSTIINAHKAFVTDVDTDNLYFRSLFKGEERLQISKWPKTGSFKVTNSKEEDCFSPNSDSGFFDLHAAFYTDKARDFANLSDVNVRIMHKWCDDILPLHSTDASTGRVEVSKPAAMTIETGDNFVYENVREALTEPGEWYLDRTEKKLYYIPEKGETAEDLVLSAPVTEKFIDINGVSNITFSGIKFNNTDWNFVSGSRWISKLDEAHPLYSNIKYNPTHPQAAYETPAVINIENASNINFVNCEFKNLSNTAVKFGINTTNCNVKSCLFDQIGANAIYIEGERKLPATTNNINVTDCHIGYYGRIYNNSIGVLLIDASDCEIAYNEIHDGWYTAISVGWVWGYSENPTNNIQIRNNLIYNIGNGWLSDMGGIYTLGIQPDTVISGNIIHNVGCYEGSTGYGGWGIYLDEGSSNITVEKNLVYDCSSNSLHQHYGKDNLIKNNIFAFSDDGQVLITRHEDHNSLYLYNNILVSEDEAMYKTAVDKDWFIDNSNIYWDYENEKKIFSDNNISVKKMQKRGYYNNAVISDPCFKDAKNRDFRIALDSPVLGTDFEVWDYEAGTLTQY
jgi:hypothetical protein